jgi:DNA repair exonuclease SbcCD ATPase subunit
MPVAPFNLFKKKDAGNNNREAEQAPAIEAPAASTLDITQVQELLQKIESAKSQALAGRLAPTRDAVAASLKSLGSIADAMEKEKIKLEEIEKRFGSTAENSKRTVVAALRRESSAEIPPIRNAADAKKFKERLEATMNRFGEVSGSHSKMINYFMQKRADMMRAEFATLNDLLKEARSALASFDQDRAPIVKCSNTINTITQKVASVHSEEASAKAAEERLAALQADIARGKAELESLKSSTEFAQAQAADARLADAQKRNEQFQSRVAEMFSHVTRAFTKYSYGVSKETERRLQLMESEPWKIYESDPQPYAELLNEVHKAVGSGKLQLKDADKVLHHLEAIRSSIPEMQKTSAALAEELKVPADAGLVQKAAELEERLAHQQEELTRDGQSLEQQRRHIAEKNAEVDGHLKEVSDGVAALAGRRYTVTR